MTDLQIDKKMTGIALALCAALMWLASLPAMCGAETEVIRKETLAPTSVRLNGMPLKEIVRLSCPPFHCQFIDVSDDVLNRNCSVNITDGTTDEILQYLASSHDLLLDRAGDNYTFRGLDSISFTFRKAPPGNSYNASFYEGEMGGIISGSSSGGTGAGTTPNGAMPTAGAAPQSQTSSTGGSSGVMGVTISTTSDKLDFWEELEKNLKKIVTKQGFFSIDRSSSLVYIVDKPSRVRMLRRYLEDIDRSLNRQVSVDITVIQIHKGGTTTVGVDWDSVFKTINNHVLEFNSSGKFSDSTMPFSIGAKLITPTATHSAVIKAIQKFADVRIVEKTNMLLRNNVAGSFSRGVQRSYLDSIARTIVDRTTTTSVTKGTILSGINIYLMPTIIGDTITLTFMPRITRLQEMEVVTIENGQIQNPILDIRKNIATVTLKNGETRIVSSISSDSKGQNDTRVPLLGGIPGLGWLFGSRAVQDEEESIVFIVTPSIIDI